jgi:hypothetical protein
VELGPIPLYAMPSCWKEDITGEYEKEMRKYASQNVKDSFGFASKQFGIGELSVVIN